MNTRPITAVSSSPDDVEAPKSFSSRKSACQHATSTNATALNTQSTTEIRPTNRNLYLETLVEGVYPNTTATTTIDKEDAAYQNRRNCPDSLGYKATRTLATWTDHRKQTKR